MIRTRVSRMLLLLFAVMVCVSVGAAEAGYTHISSLTGNPNLSGPTLNYDVTLIITAGQAELNLTSHFSGSGTGEKVFWQVSNADGAQNAGSGTITPNTSTTFTNDSSSTSVQFNGVTATDKFTITVELQSSLGTRIGSNAVVNVSFRNSVPLTGVALEKTSFTAREKAINQYLTAIPIPADATGLGYNWSTSDPQIVALTQPSASQDMALLSFVNLGTARITVTTTGYNNTSAVASCDVTVVAEDTIADDMIVKPVGGGLWEPSTGDDASVLYGADERYISLVYDVNGAEIIADSVTGSRLFYLVGSEAKGVDYRNNRTMIASAQGLNISDYATRVVAGFRLESAPSTEPGAMIPFLLSYNMLNRLYPDDTTPVETPTSESDFHNKYRIMKYFERNTTDYAIDISDILSRRMGTYMVKDSTSTTGAYHLAPLVVLVDAVAPSTGCDAYAGDNKQYGVKYDNTKKILFIYDGNPNGKIEDPILLEKRPSSGGGGGGGGCSAGAGVLALIALAGVAVVRKFRA